MTTLLVGSTGATGRLLARQLLDRGHEVRAVVRSPERLPEDIRSRSGLTVIQGSILKFSDAELAELVSGCDAFASCLGHTMTLKGIFGPPYRFVTQTTRQLCRAVRNSNGARPARFVLMNTAGNVNDDRNEQVAFSQQCILWFLRHLVPPHADNEQAANYLRVDIGQNDREIEWVAVRPDSLTDENEVTKYSICASPTRSAIFDPGKTSRVNVAHFMAELIDNDELWNQWKGQMPVIYNASAGV